MNDVITSIIRTTVTLIQGWLATQALRLSVEVDTANVAQALTLVVTVVVYSAVRWLETRVDSRFGWLLGAAKAPAYPPSK